MSDCYVTPPPQGGEVIFRDKLGNICTGIMFPDGTPVKELYLPHSLDRQIIKYMMDKYYREFAQ